MKPEIHEVEDLASLLQTKRIIRFFNKVTSGGPPVHDFINGVHTISRERYKIDEKQNKKYVESIDPNNSGEYIIEITPFQESHPQKFRISIKTLDDIADMPYSTIKISIIDGKEELRYFKHSINTKVNPPQAIIESDYTACRLVDYRMDLALDNLHKHINYYYNTMKLKTKSD